MWAKGQPWRVVNSLQKLNGQIRAYAPRAVPPTTSVDAWGSIADDQHSSSSDHYPHFYAALGATAVVCARDFPHAPALGLDGHVVTEALRVSRDARIGYLICDRRITGPNHGWQWQPYDGSDPHDTHFHVSSVHTAIADDTRPWALPGAASAAATTKGLDMLYIVGRDVFNEHGVQITNAESIAPGTKNYASAPMLAVDSKERMAELTTPRGSVNAADVAAALASNAAFLAALASAFDARLEAVVRSALKKQLDDDPAT